MGRASGLLFPNSDTTAWILLVKKFFLLRTHHDHPPTNLVQVCNAPPHMKKTWWRRTSCDLVWWAWFDSCPFGFFFVVLHCNSPSASASASPPPPPHGLRAQSSKRCLSASKATKRYGCWETTAEATDESSSLHPTRGFNQIWLQEQRGFNQIWLYVKQVGN